MEQPENDHTIIKQCQQQKPKAQHMLYQKYYGYAMAIALRYAPSHEIAKDILNDGFLKIFTSIQQFDLQKPFKPWLSQIIVYTAISRFRKEKKHLYHADITDAHEEHDLNEDALDVLMAEEIIALLQKLPDLHRITFNLYELEGYSHQEISLQLGISEATSRSNLSRAKAKLQKILHDYYRYERA